MRKQVRLLYSDNPREQMLQNFENAIGCAEDPPHLVYRCEYGCAGRRSQCTTETFALQNKFFNPIVVAHKAELVTRIYRGKHMEQVSWNAVPEAEEVSDDERLAYAKQPFQSIEEYIAQLKRVSVKFPEMMTKTDAKGRSMLDILQAACTPRHYMYSQNNSVFAAMSEHEVIKKGTISNECEHRALKKFRSQKFSDSEIRRFRDSEIQ